MDPQPTQTSALISDGGISASHPLIRELDAFVGPSTGNQLNTLRIRLIPVGCWRVEDFRFAFDSSLVTPAIKAELKHLRQLLEQHPPPSKTAPNPGSPLSVFGHADPTGNDDYNKVLSGRRAKAMYALLTRRADMWEQLFIKPFGNDKWGKAALQMMLEQVAPPASKALVTEHQRDPVLREALFLAYMESLCGPDLLLQKQDFLGHGDDAGGKADFQGCGEFNPVLVASQKDQARFDRDTDKTERNDANALSRRVMVLVFRAGSRVDPARWPCPRAGEGVAGCKKRFWSDGEQRRSKRLADAPRTFESTVDTFACRFYHRHTVDSPCERLLGALQIRVYDGFGQFIPGAPFTVSSADPPPSDQINRADHRGIITLRNLTMPSQQTIRWGFPPETSDDVAMIFSRTIFLISDKDRSPEASLKRLKNLGYDGPNDEDNIVGFQLDYGSLAEPPLEDTGEFDDRTRALVDQVHRQAADILRDTTSG